MANKRNAEKAVRQAEKRRQRNRLKAKTMRNALRRLRETKQREEALRNLPKVFSLIDRLAKSKVIHKNKAANLKSGLAKKIASLT